MAFPGIQAASSEYLPPPSNRGENTYPPRVYLRHDTEDSPSQELGHTEEPEVTYPEGGLAAWLVAIGSWCAMTAGLGLINSTGVLEAYVSNRVLPTYPASATGWIFGIYVFVSYFGGIQTGPIFDARGPKELMIFGSFCILVGVFTLSVATG